MSYDLRRWTFGIGKFDGGYGRDFLLHNITIFYQIPGKNLIEQPVHGKNITHIVFFFDNFVQEKWKMKASNGSHFQSVPFSNGFWSILRFLSY